MLGTTDRAAAPTNPPPTHPTQRVMVVALLPLPSTFIVCVASSSFCFSHFIFPSFTSLSPFSIIFCVVSFSFCFSHFLNFFPFPFSFLDNLLCSLVPFSVSHCIHLFHFLFLDNLSFLVLLLPLIAFTFISSFSIVICACCLVLFLLLSCFHSHLFLGVSQVFGGS